MADTFDLFRLSLLSREQIDAFAEHFPSRESYLRKVFGQERVFDHYGTEFHYVPAPDGEGPAMLGRIGREVAFDGNAPPSQGYIDQDYPAHKAAVVVLDPTDHPDGQKIAVQNRVGKPLQLVTALVAVINEANPNTEFQLEVQPIFDAQSFWRWAEEVNEDVTSLTFEFVTPNGLWTAKSDLKDELKDFHEALGAEIVKNTFQSEAGIKIDNPRIHDAVNYAQKGSGKIKAKARSGKKFDSTSKPKTVKIPSAIKGDEEPIIKRAARMIARILGRE